MNITTGGPHTLLFERDQQLATLLTSELQLAGYSNHTARTAVEVFDAIARYPIKLVLVNMAQAAAARREFWVALDTQRRDRKIQALSFVCSNLAGYGTREYDDVQSTNVDMEIDGMLGLMSLVDAVRARVPLANSDTGNNSTMPRMQRTFSGDTGNVPTAAPATRSSPLQPSIGSGNASSSRMNYSDDTGNYSAPSPTRMGGSASQPLPSVSPAASAQNAAAQPSYSEKIRAVLYPNQRSWNASGGQNVPAQDSGPQPSLQVPQNMTQPSVQGREITSTGPSVLPSQQSASPRVQNSVRPSVSPQSNQYPAYGNNTQSTLAAPPATEGNVLQQMANGQINADGQGESGLAQLSRMARGFFSASPAPSASKEMPAMPSLPATPSAPTYNTHRDPYNTLAPSVQQARNGDVSSPERRQPTQETPAVASANPWSIPAGASYASLEANDSARIIQASPSPAPQQPVPQQPVPQQPVPSPDGRWSAQVSQKQLESTVVRRPLYNPHTQQSVPAQPTEDLNIRAQTLRASPIQDMPIERTVTGPAVPDNSKRNDGYARGHATSGYANSLNVSRQAGNGGQTVSPLASIVNPLPSAPAAAPAARQDSGMSPSPSLRQASPAFEAPPAMVDDSLERAPSVQVPPREQPVSASDIEREALAFIKERSQQVHSQYQKQLEQRERQEEGIPAENEENVVDKNSVLLDIVQSLPPMPALSQQQSVQPQVLNGHATKSLNKVLLDGHLVPEDRLDVAQNIQRMLRGVDLNYQLGDILLMFKLLSPDQLLAASLVSYGLINTTQISALGRIRQELHAIGLEYDLENLLIMFRILTPEQLREARSSIQS